MAKKRALDFVVAVNAAYRPANKSWTRLLPESGRAEMEEVRHEWSNGKLAGVPIVVVYRGIVNRCKEEGWPAPKSETTIVRWLRSQSS